MYTCMYIYIYMDTALWIQIYLYVYICYVSLSPYIYIYEQNLGAPVWWIASGGSNISATQQLENNLMLRCGG